MSAVLLLERLSAADLNLLAEAAGEPGLPEERVARLRAQPNRIEELLGHPRVHRALFGQDGDRLVVAAPFLAFSVLLARTARALGEVSFVPEWVGPQRRVPVFDVAGLREFLDHPLRRLFLADLLSSYTHVASGTVWVKTPRGWRRRRFSELDPVRFAELIETATGAERLALYRRLGDLALFLTGVFPDHAGRRAFGPVALDRLRRVVGGPEGSGAEVPGVEDPSDLGAVGLLEWLGRRAYRRAWESTRPRDVGLARILGEVAERFADARRILNFLTDRFLFPHRERWFPAAG